ncbi:unnamed protein product [Linum trigynum]|uniref:Uncharacterized protein n=1 Tax=Linum trigynum TaxID=586398 RepID=A0AAV2FIJ0_9ROSI
MIATRNKRHKQTQKQIQQNRDHSQTAAPEISSPAASQRSNGSRFAALDTDAAEITAEDVNIDTENQVITDSRKEKFCNGVMAGSNGPEKSTMGEKAAEKGKKNQKEEKDSGRKERTDLRKKLSPKTPDPTSGPKEQKKKAQGNNGPTPKILSRSPVKVPNSVNIGGRQSGIQPSKVNQKITPAQKNPERARDREKAPLSQNSTEITPKAGLPPEKKGSDPPGDNEKEARDGESAPNNTDSESNQTKRSIDQRKS